MELSIGALITGLSDNSSLVQYAGISGELGILISGVVVMGKAVGKEGNPTPCYEYIGELFNKYAAEDGRKWENLCFESDDEFIDLVRQLEKLPISMNGKRKSLKG